MHSLFWSLLWPQGQHTIGAQCLLDEQIDSLGPAKLDHEETLGHET